MAKGKLQYLIRENEPVTVKKSLPKNYEIIEHTLTQPAGTRWARKKGEPLFKHTKSGKLILNPKREDILVVTDEDYFTTRIAQDRIYQPDKADRFMTDEVTEKKIKSKEKKMRKELKAQKERDTKGVIAAKNKSTKPAGKRTCKPKTVKPAPVAPAKNKPTSPKTAKPTSPKTTAKPLEGKSYTVRQGRTSKTFATKTEAKACASQAKNKATITTTTKPPTHRIVKFAVKK